MNRDYILVINPGSTSTKVALFRDDMEIKSHKIDHSGSELENIKKCLINMNTD